MKILMLMLACLGSWCAAAERVPMAAPNLAFEKPNPATGVPEGWSLYAKGYSASTECTPVCAVKLASIDDATGRTALAPLSQRIEPGAALGHRLILSGRIRTEKVEGHAALWLRVDQVQGPALGLDNMHTHAPTGTTGWSRFEVALNVPRHASAIVLGTMLVGRGSAWFDELKLEVDTSVNLPETVVPPRPVPSPVLLDDAALQIAPMRSLFSDDFSDLQFLKPLLAGKRLVQLGESGHGVAEFNWAKVRLIKFLHQQLGYDVIAFESSLPQCFAADQALATASPIATLQSCIFGVWNNAETLTLFDYLADARKAGRGMTLAGFDTQFSAGGDGGTKRLADMLAAIDSPLAADLAANDARLRSTTRTPFTPADTERLATYYKAVADALQARKTALQGDVALAIQSALGRAALVRQLSAGMGKAGYDARDLGMADNLDFLLDTLYPGRKVIVWAHNAHIAYAPSALGFTSMGMHVAQRRKAETYTVGLYMGRGAARTNSGALYPIAGPAPDSFEAVLANGGASMAFVDFSTAKPGPGASWMFTPIVSREWGTVPATIVPASTYDAVLYIDTVTPPRRR